MYGVIGWKRKPKICVGVAEQSDNNENDAIDLLEYQNDLTMHY